MPLDPAAPLRLVNTLPVSQAGHPAADVPAGTVVFEKDEYGNLALGNNKLLKTRKGNLLANGIVPTGLFYQQESHVLFVGGGLAVGGPGDPGDIVLYRFGPDNSWPDNGGLGVAGVPKGTSLGSFRFQGGATPVGGVPDVTLGATTQGDSASIGARATEDNRKTATGYAQGGRLELRATPNGTSTPVTGLIVDQDQTTIIVGNLRLRNVGAATPTGGQDSDMCKGDGRLWVNDHGRWGYTPLIFP